MISVVSSTAQPLYVFSHGGLRRDSRSPKVRGGMFTLREAYLSDVCEVLGMLHLLRVDVLAVP